MPPRTSPGQGSESQVLPRYGVCKHLPCRPHKYKDRVPNIHYTEAMLLYMLSSYNSSAPDAAAHQITHAPENCNDTSGRAST